MIDLSELKEAEKRATPGPWICRRQEIGTPEMFCFIEGLHKEKSIDQEQIDYGFIAISRNICRPMIEEIERLTEHKRLLFEENGRLLGEKERGEWDTNERLRTELAKAREALVFYADPFTWSRVNADSRHMGALDRFNFDGMYGEKAREALRSIDDSKLLTKETQ